ncbi:helix-turn-helix transcriptional regulator [Streptomyces sp. NPDC094049]|uniref:PadR family transcriptional regulator n=1 Tax=Streptomyces sp. NPDC094049 TaxID=3154987 RepID=UPI00332272D3
MTTHTQTVLRALLGHGLGPGQRSGVVLEGLYGLELSRLSSLPNGTLFPILERLRQAGWVERYWEEDAIAEAEGRPRRRFYKVTSKGADLAPQALAEAMAAESGKGRATAASPALGGLV